MGLLPHQKCWELLGIPLKQVWVTKRNTSHNRISPASIMNGVFVGQICLVPYHNYFYLWEEEPKPPFNCVEIELNFAFGKQYWGKSYAYEASNAMIRHAFDAMKLPRLVGGTGADNQRSLNLHRRLGYRIFEALPIEGIEYAPGIVAVLNNERK